MGIREWRAIQGWPCYEISNDGCVQRVVSAQGGGIRVLTPCPHPGGYLKISLYENRRYKKYYIHRLVALAFIGPPPEPHWDVDHVDGDRRNNHVSNLEWVSRGENLRRGRERAKRRQLEGATR